MGVKLRPDEITEKWARKLKGATEDIKRGVQRLEENPCERAIEQVEVLKKKLIEAIESGRWANQLRKVSLEEWKRKMTEFGVAAISKGVDKAKDKRAEFDRWLVEAVNSALSEIKTPYTGELEDSIARMEEFIRAMAKRKYKG